MFQIIGAKTTLIPIYNAGKAIDGEVLVGNEFSNTLDEYGRQVLDKNDLLFGEGGNDYMYGHGGEDVLYGGAGSDTLQGDAGDEHVFGGDENDTLRGSSESDVLEGGIGDDRLYVGAGNDTYYYTTGDGLDRIEDADADGGIKVNGQMLVGGDEEIRPEQLGQCRWYDHVRDVGHRSRCQAERSNHPDRQR